ncbi:MAG: sigma-54 dependent transcriptional regulator [Polyangiaceae bacterium]
MTNSDSPPANEPVPACVAVVDDDPTVRRLLRAWLEAQGYRVSEHASARSILEAGVSDLSALCLDLELGDATGIEVLKQIRTDEPELPVIVVTADADISTVVDAMRAGAYDYVIKPLERERVVVAVGNAIERTLLTRRVWALSRTLDDARALQTLVGQSPVMRKLAATVQRVLHSDVAVCILGESGTGKELVARAIHQEGRRKRGPFVAINCAAIPDNLQESELFGHERGAFTGANAVYRGRFEQAEGGTLFLDELGDMNASTQVKLLRALQEKTIRRIGGSHDIRTNVRVICATHKNLEREVSAGRFREDLYFRLMVYPVEVPSLRERLEDIPLLVAHFMKVLREDVGREVSRLSPQALEALSAHAWPGNVRELQNVIHRAMLSSRADMIELADLPNTLQKAVTKPLLPNLQQADSSPAPAPVSGNALPTLNLRDLEQLAIQQALKQTQGHVAHAAKLLGIGRATLYRRLVESGATVDEGTS